MECKHRNGILHNHICKAGVNRRDLAGQPDYGWMARLPCVPDSPITKNVVKCDKYEAKTKAEIIAEELELMDYGKNLVLAIETIKKDGRQQGEVSCPKCYAGKINFSIAKINGHIWGKCSTENCLKWMQ